MVKVSRPLPQSLCYPEDTDPSLRPASLPGSAYGYAEAGATPRLSLRVTSVSRVIGNGLTYSSSMTVCSSFRTSPAMSASFSLRTDCMEAIGSTAATSV